MRTPPPCKIDGVDCERRCAEPNCHTYCPEWLKWTEVHNAELAEEQRKKNIYIEADIFMKLQGERTRRDNVRKGSKKARREHRK